MHLHTHDVFSPFPQEHHGQYDVVHMRFMISLLTEENLLPLLENLASLLSKLGALSNIQPLTINNPLRMQQFEMPHLTGNVSCGK